LVLTVVVVGAAEILAQVATAPLGPFLWQYWDGKAAQQHEWYRQQALAGATPAVVAVGDSVAARNFDPLSFSNAAGGVETYNLGWPGMFPLALDSVIPALLEQGTAPKYLLLLQAPMSFLDIERVRFNEGGILNSMIARRAMGGAVAGERVALARIYAERREVIDYWLRGEAAVRQPPLLGFMPFERDSDAAQDDPGVVDAPEGELDPRRLAVNLRLMELARRRRIRVIAVIAPLAVDVAPPTVDAYLAWLDSQAALNPDPLTVWDMSQWDLVGQESYRDAVHFWRDGAEAFSQSLGERFAEEFPDR